MAAASFRITCVGLPSSWDETVQPVAEAAAEVLGLAEVFSGVRICLDDLPGSGDAWFRPGPAAVPGGLPVLTLFCHEECFGPAPRPGGPVQPPRPVWEQAPAPSRAEQVAFDPSRAAAFLHHHFLVARDLGRGDVVGRHLPPVLSEAFTEAWAVTVDGRLAREGLPGFCLAERRGRFARIFSPAGILLPDHWQVFQSLWDGALKTQQEVLDAVRRLPGL